MELVYRAKRARMQPIYTALLIFIHMWQLMLSCRSCSTNSLIIIKQKKKKRKMFTYFFEAVNSLYGLFQHSEVFLLTNIYLNVKVGKIYKSIYFFNDSEVGPHGEVSIKYFFK